MVHVRFNPPPGWPQPPSPSWLPPAAWQPDPAWPAPPDHWQWYLPAAEPARKAPRWLTTVALLIGIPWVLLWLMVSSLIPMAADSACVSDCHDTLFGISILGTWAIEIVLACLSLYLLGTRRGTRRTHQGLAFTVLVVGVPVVCVSGWILAGYSLGR